jgi:hypothetical protein
MTDYSYGWAITSSKKQHYYRACNGKAISLCGKSRRTGFRLLMPTPIPRAPFCVCKQCKDLRTKELDYFSRKS